MKNRTPVTSIMSKNVITLNSKDDLSKAELLFKNNKIRHIPVVSGDKIIGMLSYTDLLRISFADAVDDDADILPAFAPAPPAPPAPLGATAPLILA